MARTKPKITIPVSRFLAVADLGRSMAFYRDVLGFEMKTADDAGNADGAEKARQKAEKATTAEGAEKARTKAETTKRVEVVYGPARIQLVVGDSVPDSTLQSRPRGSAIVFFEIDDVSGMREAVLERGGKPSEIERANWIKMRVFEIRDPDGHILWFAQTYQEPDTPKPEPMLQKIMPDMPLSDVQAGVAYYRDVLGFSINYERKDFAVMYRDEATILLIQRTVKHTGIGSCYLYVRDADALHAEFVGRGANVQGEPVSQPWGLRDFSVLDPEGNKLSFGQTFE